MKFKIMIIDNLFSLAFGNKYKSDDITPFRPPTTSINANNLTIILFSQVNNLLVSNVFPWLSFSHNVTNLDYTASSHAPSQCKCNNL